MTFPPNWKIPTEYPDLLSTAPTSFAWEFLRRNPGYQEAYSGFAKRYRALLKRYPKAEKDEAAWNALQGDEGAKIYEPPKFRGESDDAWAKRVGEGSTIHDMFTWYAAPWSMGRQLTDPANDHPKIFWDRSPGLVRMLTPSGCDEYLGRQNGKIALGFDLSLPIPAQIEAAKRFLDGRKQDLRTHKNSPIPKADARPLRGLLVEYLRILDAMEAGAADNEIGEILYPSVDNKYPDYLRKHRVRAAKKAAIAMRDHRYRDLLMSK